MDNNIKFRTELKYRCSEKQLSVIKSRLDNLLKYDPHTSEEGVYTIRSMYFDSYNNRCYYENENGVDPREKFRIRIYNASDSRISLECKHKERNFEYKESCILTKQQFDGIMKGGSLSDIENSQPLLRKFTYLMKTELFRPAVIVEYERTPYVYKIGNVRITLDRNIRSSKDYNGFFEKNIRTRQILPEGEQLLEVKYDEFLPDFLKDVLELGNLQQTAFSKYYLCRKFSAGGKI